MEDTYNKNQWKFMEEMCILVDNQDHPIGSDSKRNCIVADVVQQQAISETRKMDQRCVIALSAFFFSICKEDCCCSVGRVRRLRFRCTGRIHVAVTLWMWTERLIRRMTTVSNGRCAFVEVISELPFGS